MFLLANNSPLLLVSCYNPPDSLSLHSNFDTVSSSFVSVVLVGDLNYKHVAWNCNNVDRNGCTLLSVYQENVAVNLPKIYGIVLRKHCNLSKQVFPALSFDLNPVVFKILLCSFFYGTRQILFYYKQADWSLFRSALD